MKKMFLSFILIVVLVICVVDYFSPAALASTASCESENCSCTCSSASAVCSCTAGNGGCSCTCEGTSNGSSCGKADQMQ